MDIKADTNIHKYVIHLGDQVYMDDAHDELIKDGTTNDKDTVRRTYFDVYKQNYTNNISIMTNPEIRKEWEETVNKYKEYLSNREELWRLNLKKVIDYMDTEKKSPNKRNKDSKTLGNWIGTQKKII